MSAVNLSILFEDVLEDFSILKAPIEDIRTIVSLMGCSHLVKEGSKSECLTLIREGVKSFVNTSEYDFCGLVVQHNRVKRVDPDLLRDLSEYEKVYAIPMLDEDESESMKDNMSQINWEIAKLNNGYHVFHIISGNSTRLLAGPFQYRFSATAWLDDYCQSKY